MRPDRPANYSHPPVRAVRPARAGTSRRHAVFRNGLELVNVGSNRCLDATGNSSADGTRLQIWDCANTANQQWNLPG